MKSISFGQCFLVNNIHIYYYNNKKRYAQKEHIAFLCYSVVEVFTWKGLRAC